jgi:hypothetical protein
LKSDGNLEIVFYDGKIKTPSVLVGLLQNPENYPVFVLVDGHLRGLAWFNDLRDGHATAHFCVFKEAWGVIAREMGKKVLDYWFSFPHPSGSGPLLNLVLGVTPSHYTWALRFISQIGFKQVGEVPNILYHAYENRRVNAVLSYRERPT